MSQPCIVITGLGVGGAEQTLLKVLPELECDPFVISLTDHDAIGKKLEAGGVDVHYLGLGAYAWNLPAVMARFINVLRDEQPSKVVSFLIHSHVFTRFTAPLFVDEIMCSIRLKHKPSLLTWIEYATNGWVDHYLPNSPALIPWLKERGVNDDRITIVPNGVDIDKFDIDIDESAKRDELGIPEDAFVVGSVGRLHRQKRYKDLLGAAKDLDVQVLLVGDGPEREKLAEQARRNDMEARVHLPGRRDDIPEILQVMDVFCLPSENEGMSNALLEAMASGCNCIVSDIDENNVLVENGISGRLFSVGNSSALVSELKKIQREALGQNAKNTVQTKFSLANTLRRYRTLLQCH